MRSPLLGEASRAWGEYSAGREGHIIAEATFAERRDTVPIHLVLGDLTRFPADAIVNAANSDLWPGGGVSGAIHRAAGPAVAAEGRAYVAEHGPVPTGQAAATTAGNLSGVRYVVHAVGPVWHGGRSGEAEALASAYSSAVRVADDLGCASIAFPSISTGIYGFPLEMAAPVAVRAVSDALAGTRKLKDATFVLFSARDLETYERALLSISAP
jgi:O-acetyl-ADP-ribose deacetylase (regulator of RNase III)